MGSGLTVGDKGVGDKGGGSGRSKMDSEELETDAAARGGAGCRVTGSSRLSAFNCSSIVRTRLIATKLSVLWLAVEGKGLYGTAL